ncbi:hypothetical protein MP228_002576 [Amoeboaphelidium protococcarum]|nr:hypothetical protein MP228_002576 [Amoeboaphelidium protococcarum]
MSSLMEWRVRPRCSVQSGSATNKIVDSNKSYHNNSAFYLSEERYRNVRRYDPHVEVARMLAISAALREHCGLKSAWLRVGYGRSVSDQFLSFIGSHIDTVLADFSIQLQKEDNTILVSTISANPLTQSCLKNFYRPADISTYIDAVNAKAYSK